MNPVTLRGSLRFVISEKEPFCPFPARRAVVALLGHMPAIWFTHYELRGPTQLVELPHERLARP